MEISIVKQALLAQIAQGIGCEKAADLFHGIAGGNKAARFRCIYP